MKQIFTLLAAVLLTATTQAQVGVGTTTPDASAALDITSTTKGLLIPRMTNSERNFIVSPASGLVLWCSDCATEGELQVYNGIVWVKVGTKPGTLVGQMRYWNGTAWVVIVPGIEGQTLTYINGLPRWVD